MHYAQSYQAPPQYAQPTGRGPFNSPRGYAQPQYVTPQYAQPSYPQQSYVL